MSKSNNKSKALNDKSVVVLALGVITFYFVANSPQFLALFSGKKAETKVYEDFNSFYPFYLSQHADETCKMLHIIGTLFVIGFSIFDVNVILSLCMGCMVGLGVFNITKSIPHGAIEMAAMMCTYLIFMYKFNGSIKKALLVPIIAYSFAWCGHFVFEHNRPATFTYASFSLIGDFRMTFEFFRDMLIKQ